MNRVHKAANKVRQYFYIGLAALPLVGVLSLAGGPVSAAACVQTTDYGQVSGSVTLPGSATYRVWTRVMVPDTTNNTYLLEIGGNCYTVGGGTIPVNTWTWVASQNGSATSKVDVALNAGQVAYKLIGNKPGVKLDKLVFTSDLTCTPTGDGSNCNTPSDTQAPTVQLTAPTEGGTVSGPVAVTATATDNTAVTKVEFYVNSNLVKTSTASPYSYQWDTASLANGTYLLSAKAFDAAGNVSTDSMSVSVQNSDQQAPSVPTNLKASAPAYNRVALTWSASTDNVGVVGYVVLKDTVPVATLDNVTSYTDSNVNANTAYSYQVQAVDKAGNKSAPSTAAQVTTPLLPDTQAPTTPGGLSASAVNQSQINLTWSASTDNVGVNSYDVYRGTGTASPQKITTVTTTSFGDTGLKPSTSYTYYVVAKDGAGNQSQHSATATATTQASKKKRGTITGTVTSQATGKALRNAVVVLSQEGSSQKQMFQASSDGTYRIGRLEPGLYHLTFRAYGYRSTTFSTTITEGSTVTKDIKLQKR